jgi:Flp pilus assembly protein TadG
MQYRSESWRRLAAHREGSAATEFALIAPLFSTLLLATVEMGSLLYSYSAMQMTASMSARRMAVNQVAATPANARAADFLPNWATGAVTATVTQSHATDPGANTIVLTLSAPADKLAVVSLLTRMVPWTMTSRVTIKQELPYED